MELAIVRENGILIASPQGRLDGSNAQEFQGDLTEAIDSNDRAVVLDLGQLSLYQQRGPSGYSDYHQSVTAAGPGTGRVLAGGYDSRSVRHQWLRQDYQGLGFPTGRYRQLHGLTGLSSHGGCRLVAA